MRTLYRNVLAAAVSCCVSLGSPPASGAQTQDALFDATVVHEVRLYLHSADFQQLRERFREDTYYPADFEWAHMRVRNVAIRSRGVASRNAGKPGLRIDFNRLTTGQEFLGLESLVLDNLWQHGSMVTESVAMAFFQRMGQPAPREAYARVFINNEYHGLYAMVEVVDTEFLTRTIADDTGYLFSYQQPLDQFRAEDLGDDLGRYKVHFEAESHEVDDDTTLYAPIRELFREVNGVVDAVWRERTEQYLDLTQFVTHVAIENFLAENDGLLGWSGMNNFYLYRSLGSPRHRILTWDKDTAFDRIAFPILERSTDNVIFRTAMLYPDLHTLYLQTLEVCARVAAEDRWLENEIVRQATLIDAAVREDSRKQFSNETFDDLVASLIEFARQRPAFVLQEVTNARSAINGTFPSPSRLSDHRR